MITLLLALLGAAGCTGPDSALTEIVPSQTAGMPENHGAWNTTIHTFSSGECKSVEYCRFSETGKTGIKGKGRVTVTTFSSTTGVDFYPKEKGHSPERYLVKVKDLSAGMPEIWTGSAEYTKGQDVAKPEMQKVTSTVSLEVTGATADFTGADISLGICHDALYIFDGKTGFADSQQEAILPFGPQGGKLNAMPMAGTGETSEVTVNVKNGKSVYPVKLDIRRLGMGGSAAFTIDLSKIESDRIIDVSCKVSDKYEYSTSFDTSDLLSDYSKLNKHYDVYIGFGNGKWQSVRVNDALCSDAAKHSSIWNDWNNSKALRDTMSYAIFEVKEDGPVKVRVRRKTGSFSKAEVRPSPYGITANKISNSLIEFELPSIKQGKVSVEFDGDRQHNLFLFGHVEDKAKPDAGDPNVRYFGPGEHEAGEIALTEGQTLYIDYGATVYGTVRVRGNDITMAGHGVLSGAKLRHWGEQYYSNGEILIDLMQHKKGLTFKDITIIDSPSWAFRMQNHANATIDGVNIINWILNGDGLDILSSRDIEIKNCFIRTYDDAITLKARFTASPVSDLCDVRIHDNIIFSDYARGIIVGPEAGNTAAGTGSIHDVTIENCHFLQHGGGRNQSDDIRAAFAIGQYARYGYSSGSATDIERITARNLFFDSIGASGRTVSVIQDKEQDTPCVMRDILFENFTIVDNNHSSSPAFYVNTNQNSIESMTVRGCTFAGSRITGIGTDFVVTGTGKADITFE